MAVYGLGHEEDEGRTQTLSMEGKVVSGDLLKNRDVGAEKDVDVAVEFGHL